MQMGEGLPRLVGFLAASSGPDGDEPPLRVVLLA
jgi:hypothetical protein